jgi:hypothetical protein
MCHSGAALKLLHSQRHKVIYVTRPRDTGHIPLAACGLPIANEVVAARDKAHKPLAFAGLLSTGRPSAAEIRDPIEAA